MSPTVLIIDDDKMPMDYYERALLKRKFIVERCLGTDEARKLLTEWHKPLDLIVLDVMMPPGETFTMDETEEGVITGVFLHKFIRARFANLPIIIFTNSQNPALEQRFEGHPQTRLLLKKDWPPFMLATEINTMISPQP